MTKGRLMIIEDERFSATVLQRTVERLDYEVVGNVQNGQDAIEIFKKELPDAVIMDFNIQGELDGGDLYKVFEGIKKVPNIFITSTEDEESLQKIMETKPDAYIQKPFELRELGAVLELALYKSEKEQELKNLLENLDRKVKDRTKELDQTVKKLEKEISEKEKVQLQLEESLKTEKKFGKLKSSIVSNLSHEFKTPLSTINSSAQFLRTLIERKRFDKLNTKHTDRIEEAIHHLSDLLTRILMVEENSEDMYNVHFEEFHLNDLMKTLISESRFAECRNVQLEYIDQIEGGLVKSDMKLLKLVVSNIISNACKYSSENGKVLVKASSDKDSFKLIVEDNGIGMSESDLKQIFYRFYRGENVGSIEGTGIGLSIMKRSLDALGGTVDIESELGKGSSFTVTIPFNHT